MFLHQETFSTYYNTTRNFLFTYFVQRSNWTQSAAIATRAARGGISVEWEILMAN